MQHFCPICGTALSSPDAEICLACNPVTSVGESSQAVETRAPPARTRRARQRISRPSHISIKDDGSTLSISFRWVWRKFTGPAAMCLVWNAFVTAWYWGALRAEEVRIMWFAIVWGTPFAAVGLLLVYGTLAGLLNRTVIKATSELITVRTGPLPWWGNQRLAVGDIERLFWHKQTASPEGGESSFWSVSAETNGADNAELVSDIDELVQAQFITQELERWLKTGDRGIGREMHC